MLPTTAQTVARTADATRNATAIRNAATKIRAFSRVLVTIIILNTMARAAVPIADARRMNRDARRTERYWTQGGRL